MPKSVEKYTNERKELLQKLFSILEVSENSNMISLKKIEEDVEKQKQIIDLETDIKKYFVCSRWNYFTNKHRELKRNYLSLIRSICKEMEFNMSSSTLIRKDINGKPKSETYYIFDF